MNVTVCVGLGVLSKLSRLRRREEAYLKNSLIGIRAATLAMAGRVSDSWELSIVASSLTVE
jgi:hypothetical protein